MRLSSPNTRVQNKRIKCRKWKSEKRACDRDAVHLKEGLEHAALRQAPLHRDDHDRIRRPRLHCKRLQIHEPAPSHLHECCCKQDMLLGLLGSVGANVEQSAQLGASLLRGHAGNNSCTAWPL